MEIKTEKLNNIETNQERSNKKWNSDVQKNKLTSFFFYNLQ